MESLYVVEPGCYLRRQGASIMIFKGRQLVEKIPAAGLTKLMIMGYVSLTGSVLDFLIKNRIETVLLTPTGRFRARLAIDEHRHVDLRRAQYLKLSDAKFISESARNIVAGKINNMACMLQTRARREKSDHLRMAAAKLFSMKTACERDTPEVNRLRGFEGAATRVYFSAFESLIKNDNFGFKGRNRRPPKDPVNALLSFVYTLLTNEVLSAIKTAGLDPYLGALHEVSYGRPSLACDLVEEYRSYLGERMVLGIINKRMITPDDFIYRKNGQENYVDEKDLRQNRPVLMKPTILKTFVAAYEEMMKRKIYYQPDDCRINYRRLLLRQAAAFGKYLLDPEKKYQPFQWKV